MFDDETAVESSPGSYIHMLQSCQEEADTLIILHAKAAHREGYERLVISSRDTDVLELLIYVSGRRYIAIHDISLPPCIKISWHIIHLQGAIL